MHYCLSHDKYKAQCILKPNAGLIIAVKQASDLLGTVNKWRCYIWTAVFMTRLHIASAVHVKGYNFCDNCCGSDKNHIKICIFRPKISQIKALKNDRCRKQAVSRQNVMTEPLSCYTMFLFIDHPIFFALSQLLWLCCCPFTYKCTEL